MVRLAMGRWKFSGSAIAGWVLWGTCLVVGSLTVEGWRDGERCAGGGERCQRGGSGVKGRRQWLLGGYKIEMGELREAVLLTLSSGER